jgi:hypothetical protein
MLLRVFFAAIVLTGCATPTTTPHVVGPYASHLSSADVEQIRVIICKGPRSSSREATVEAFALDRARVDTRIIQPSGFEHLRYTVVKHGEIWSAEAHSFNVLESRGQIIIP